MRILQVINSLSPGGAEKLVLETSKIFIREGHQVGILLLRDSDSPYMEEAQNVEGLRLHHLPKGSKLYSPSCMYQIMKTGVLGDYDVAHVHLFPAFYWMGALAFTGKTPPLVYTEHNTTNRRRKNFFFRLIDNLIYPQYKIHITISEAVKASLQKHIWNTNKLRTIYNGIDLQKYIHAKGYEKESLGFSDTDFILIQVSSFTPQKNQKSLIEALHFLPEKVKVLLVGTGPQESLLKKFVEEEGLTDRVRFLGVRQDVPNLLKTANAIILSSHYEGLSLSSVEGLASGKPFLASDVPGLTEVVENAGILFQDNNPMALANAIFSVLNDPDYSARVSELGQERARRYDIEGMCKSYLQIYSEITTPN